MPQTAKLEKTLGGQASILCDQMSAGIEEDLNKNGLTLGMFDLLGAVSSAGAKATQAEVARRLGITAPSLCEAVKGAVKTGLLEQSPSARDGRAKIIHLTQAGSQALRASLQRLNYLENLAVQGMTREEIDTAVRVLEQANKNLGKALGTVYNK